MLPDRAHAHAPSLWRRLVARITGRPLPAFDATHAPDPEGVYETPFYRALRRVIAWCVGHRVTILVATLAAFVGALALFRFVPQQFFPASSRVELLVDLRLPEGSSFAASLAAAKKLEAVLVKDPGVESFVTYVGSGSPRFYLPLDQQLQQAELRAGRADREEHRGARAGAGAAARSVRTRLPATCGGAFRGSRTDRRSDSRCSSGSRARILLRCEPSRSRWPT